MPKGKKRFKKKRAQNIAGSTQNMELTQDEAPNASKSTTQNECVGHEILTVLNAPRKIKKPNPANEPIFHVEKPNDLRLNLKTVTIESKQANVDTKQDSINQQMANTGPRMGNIGQQMGNSGPRMGNTGQQMGNSGPRMGNTGQKMGNSGPRMGNTGQQMANSGPRMGNSGPRMGNTGQQMGNSGPRMGNTDQQKGNSGPRMGIIGQQMGNSGPRMGNTGQQIGNSGPRMGNTGQQMSNSGPRMGNIGQQMGNNGPRMGNFGQQMINSGPQMGNVDHQMNNSGPQMGNFGQQMSGSVPQIGMFDPGNSNYGHQMGNNGPPIDNYGPPMGNYGPPMGNNDPPIGNKGQYKVGNYVPPSLRKKKEPANARRPLGIPRSFLHNPEDNSTGELGYQINEGQGASEPYTPYETSPEGKPNVFSRLGPKLTINLITKNETTMRDVTESQQLDQYIPPYHCGFMVKSTNEIVKTYLPLWAKAKSYKMTGYPPDYTKEDVLDLLISIVQDKHFVPCFIEFSPKFCTFMIMRCQKAFSLLGILNMNIKDSYVLKGRVSKLGNLTVHSLNFIPRLVVRKIILTKSDGDKLDLSAFCLQKDLSHIVYYPLNDLGNQSDLHMLETSTLKNVVHLDLSNNRLTTIQGFNLVKTAPKLKKLNLSNNKLERFGELIALKGLLLTSINLENNPLCQNFIQTVEYIQCLQMIFPTLVEIDGVTIRNLTTLPEIKQNYCPHSAEHVVAKYLEVFYPLLDTSQDDRMLLEGVYDEDAKLSVSFRRRLRNHPKISYFHKLFHRANDLRVGVVESVRGADNIVTLLCMWPNTVHDPSTFHIDVLYHEDNSTALHIEGVMKIPSTIGADEPTIFFARTVLLRTYDGVNYLIKNEMVTWDAPSEAYEKCAFKRPIMIPKSLKTEFEAPPSEEMKEKLIEIFSKITESEYSYSEQILSTKNWNLTKGIEYFITALTTSLK